MFRNLFKEHRAQSRRIEPSRLWGRLDREPSQGDPRQREEPCRKRIHVR